MKVVSQILHVIADIADNDGCGVDADEIAKMALLNISKQADLEQCKTMLSAIQNRLDAIIEEREQEQPTHTATIIPLHPDND